MGAAGLEPPMDEKKEGAYRLVAVRPDVEGLENLRNLLDEAMRGVCYLGSVLDKIENATLKVHMAPFTGEDPE